MARFALSFLAVFMLLAALALSLPTKTDDLTPGQELGLDSTLNDLKSATKMMNGMDNEDTNNQDDDIKSEPSASLNSAEDKDDDDMDDEEEKVKNNKPTKTEKKPTSGKFQTPTATKTDKPTSQPNALGKIPIIGGLLGGTGSGL